MSSYIDDALPPDDSWEAFTPDPAVDLAARVEAAEREAARQQRVIAELTERLQAGAVGAAGANELDERVRARNRQFAHALVELRRSHDQLASAAEAKQALVDELEETNRNLRREQEERLRMESELMLAHKLEAVGELASGIAHEINTPIQFIGDSGRFLARATPGIVTTFAAMRRTIEVLKGIPGQEALAAELEGILEETDVEFTVEEMPRALERIAQGVERVSVLVKAMKEFGHPGQRDPAPAEINQLLETTLTVARNEYKYVADLETHYGALPLVPCVVNELNQVFLNLIVNAAHAIAQKTAGTEDRGRIVVRTHEEDGDAVVQISDTGGGIPESIQTRIFDPFFTTKAPGKGTGQGLAIARSIVVDRHGGSLTFHTEPGVGTTFTLRIPTRDRRQPAEEAA